MHSHYKLIYLSLGHPYIDYEIYDLLQHTFLCFFFFYFRLYLYYHQLSKKMHLTSGTNKPSDYLPLASCLNFLTAFLLVSKNIESLYSLTKSCFLTLQKCSYSSSLEILLNNYQYQWTITSHLFYFLTSKCN